MKHKSSKRKSPFIPRRFSPVTFSPSLSHVLMPQCFTLPFAVNRLARSAGSDHSRLQIGCKPTAMKPNEFSQWPSFVLWQNRNKSFYIAVKFLSITLHGENMYTVFLQGADRGIGMGYEHFVAEFENICEDHIRNGRARAFAFIFYDMTNGPIRAALKSERGFEILNALTGKI